MNLIRVLIIVFVRLYKYVNKYLNNTYLKISLRTSYHLITKGINPLQSNALPNELSRDVATGCFDHLVMIETTRRY
jgi:hypothetical protein